jgi:hypothetical protein
MKWIAYALGNKEMTFVIERQVLSDLISNNKEYGFYLYVFENGQGTHDYLQDSLEAAQDFALEKFQVPLQAWKEAEKAS